MSEDSLDGGYIQTCAVILFPWKVSEMYEVCLFLQILIEVK